MRSLIVAALLLPVPAVADIAYPRGRSCAVDNRVLDAKAGTRDGIQRLDRLPAAAEYLTVYRAVDGCPAPVVVRYGIGAPRR